MKRLIAKPRKKKKELKLTVKFVFEAFSDDENEAKGDIKAFRNWIRDEFPNWSDSILQHFLYQNIATILLEFIRKMSWILLLNLINQLQKKF